MQEERSTQEAIKRFVEKRTPGDFGIIYDEYVEDVYRFVLSKCNSTHLAEEVVSDTFTELIKIISQYDEKKAKFSTFLFGIAFNKLRQRWALSKHAKETSLEDELSYDEIESTYRSGKSNAFSTKRKELRIAISKLKDSYKHVIRLRFYESCNIAEVAELLNISPSNVTTIQNRAIAKLKVLINESET